MGTLRVRPTGESAHHQANVLINDKGWLYVCMRERMQVQPYFRSMEQREKLEFAGYVDIHYCFLNIKFVHFRMARSNFSPKE